ncbi:MAG: FAD-linked oxidase C-terminal domain-containing protein, partial [Nocardioidaceae bacterium]
TGEHGIGVLKRHWLEKELDPTAFSVQQSIKRVLDPTGILNPGKVFERPDRCQTPQGWDLHD